MDYATGVSAAQEFAALVSAQAPAGTTPAQAAIAWLWQHPQVSCVIPGARNVAQARANGAAGRVPPLGAAFDQGVREIYEEHLHARLLDAGHSPRENARRDPLRTVRGVLAQRLGPSLDRATPCPRRVYFDARVGGLVR